MDRAEYLRNWRRANPDKVAAIRSRYILRRYLRELEERAAVEGVNVSELLRRELHGE